MTAAVELQFPNMAMPIQAEVWEQDLGAFLTLMLTLPGASLVGVSINQGRGQEAPAQPTLPSLDDVVEPEPEPRGKRISDRNAYPNTRRNWSQEDHEILDRWMTRFPDTESFTRHIKEISAALSRTEQAVLTKRWSVLNPEKAKKAGRKSTPPSEPARIPTPAEVAPHIHPRTQEG